MNQSSNFLRGSFSNRDNAIASIHFRRESQPWHRPIHSHINSTSVIRLVKRNQLSFSSTEINKTLPVPVHSVLQIRFKFRSQFQLLPQIRCLITFRVEGSSICLSDLMGFTNTKVLDGYTDIFPKVCHVQILSDIAIIESSVLIKGIYKNMFTRNIINIQKVN